MSAKYDLDFLNHLINDEVEESLHLDYKASAALAKTDAKKKEVSKDVSAMANSDGGAIIYGIKEYDEADKKHLPERIDPINRTDISKEWIEQVINANIHPKINNLLIVPVPINNDEVVYCVKIPKSDTVHQAIDKKYYKRYNFESQAMDDYEIRDILNRGKNPIIEISFQFTEQRKQIIIFLENKGKVLAQYVQAIIYFPSNVIKFNETDEYQRIKKDEMEYDMYSFRNTHRDIIEMQHPFGTKSNDFFHTPLNVPKYSNVYFLPVLPGIKRRFSQLSFQNNQISKNRTIHWLVYADNATEIGGSVDFIDIPII